MSASSAVSADQAAGSDGVIDHSCSIRSRAALSFIAAEENHFLTGEPVPEVCVGSFTNTSIHGARWSKAIFQRKGGVRENTSCSHGIRPLLRNADVINPPLIA